MLDKILNDESLMAAHPNLYNGLLDPEAKPPAPTPITNQFLNVEKEQVELWGNQPYYKIVLKSHGVGKSMSSTVKEAQSGWSRLGQSWGGEKR